MTAAERSRLLRECAVDLIRASDLEPSLSAYRVSAVIKDLGEIATSYNADLRLSLAFADSGAKSGATRLKKVA